MRAMSTDIETPTLFDPDRPADPVDPPADTSAPRRGHLTLVFSADDRSECGTRIGSDEATERSAVDNLDNLDSLDNLTRGMAGMARLLGLDAGSDDAARGYHPAGRGAAPRETQQLRDSGPDGFGSSSTAREPRHLAQLSRPARTLRRQILAEGLASGSPVDANALSAILAAKIVNHPVPVNLFTEDMVWQLVWIDVFAWCANRGLRLPDDVPETLWTLLNHLHASGELHEQSSPIAELRGPLQSSAGLGSDGSSRKPTGRRNA